LFLLRAWRAADRSERLWWLALSLAVFCLPLTADTGHSVAGMIQTQNRELLLVRAISFRVFGFFVFGSTLTYPFPSEGWVLVTSVSLLLTCGFGYMAIAAVVKSKLSARERLIPIMLFYLILALPVLIVLRQEWLHFFSAWGIDAWRGNDRYFFCSTLLLCVLCGVFYERVYSKWMMKSRRRCEFSILLLLCWLSVHAVGFRLYGWQTVTQWSFYARKIRTAEAEVREHGGHEAVHIKNKAEGFDFDLLIMKRSPDVKH
jgi:hypothetical protein